RGTRGGTEAMSLIIDADAHVCEPKDIFTTRMPKKYGDLIPQVRYSPEDDADYWFVGDIKAMSATFSVVFQAEDGSYERRAEGGGSEPGFEMFPSRFEQQHPSSYDPNERVKVMDDFGIHAATTYPNMGLANPGIYKAGHLNDIDYQMSIVSAYNDWVMT